MQSIADMGLWLVALVGATVLRYEFELGLVDWAGILLVWGLAVVLQAVAGRVLGIYAPRWRYGTFEEAISLGASVFVVTVCLAVLDPFLLGHPMPVSAVLMAGPLAGMFMVALRVGWRFNLERQRRNSRHEQERVIVFGAGEGGEQLISAILSNSSTPFRPVALLDDNPELKNLRIKNVRVRGGRDELAAVAEAAVATTMIIAIPSASSELLRELSAAADDVGLKTLVLPTVSDLFGSPVGIGDVRPLTEIDLLGRREIQTDLDSVSGYISGKRILVTGAGGSIGSELCRQLHRFAPESLVMLDRDETALQGVQISIEGRGLLDNPELVVACIRDKERVFEIFETFRPEVVFHAAALKHLPLLEMHPDEGHKTNVLGTLNLLEAAGEFGVDRFVNVSTDKAADASSVLGRTKRVAERLTSWADESFDCDFMSVRFGNVLGSRGSVLPLFRAQIEAGGPITVTDEKVTRYFMTIPEACELVIQAGAIGSNGDAMVLDMGEPVFIADIARRLAAQAPRRIEIVYTGLRPGEKMDEVLFGDEEESVSSSHPMISKVGVPSLPPAFAANATAHEMVVDVRDKISLVKDSDESLAS